MQKSVVIFLVLISLCFLCGLDACRKKEVTPTPFSNLLGTWVLTKTATDDNGTGTDPVYYPVAAGQKYYLVFNPDSSGKDSEIYNGILSPVQLFSWEITTNDSVYVAYHANYDVVYSIFSVTSASLSLASSHLTPSGVKELTWNYYEKR